MIRGIDVLFVFPNLPGEEINHADPPIDPDTIWVNGLYSKTHYNRSPPLRSFVSYPHHECHKQIRHQRRVQLDSPFFLSLAKSIHSALVITPTNPLGKCFS